ncbi:MAG: carboxylesterase family protein [Gammaproteobacteria bacterium]|nr:carboxylesterase family protein [Gammaproteobacteria bacterium]
MAETTTGPVMGRLKEGVLLFAGIPYAAPPVDGLRFRAALPHPAWTDVRPALKFGAAAPQVATGGLTDGAPARWNEDCLTLNITTPALDTGHRPVLVWIHGGGYRTGQGAIPWYNGARFAANGDIVVVSINYRLGALGFTDLSRFGEQYASSGVNGILDQITALTWVRDNITHFGGDPKKVTIAGESAGGFAVSTLLGCPCAQGLFRAAIAQSGAAHHTLPAEAGEKVADRFLDVLGVNDAIGIDAIDVGAILKAQQTVSDELEGPAGALTKLGVAVSAFYPVVGNEILPQSPLTAIQSGMGAEIPLLIGSNRHETTLWGYGEVDDPKLDRMVANFGAGKTLAVYRSQRPRATPQDLMIALTTDHMFRIPAIRLVEAREPHGAKSWMYWFCWESRAFGGTLKATHALEIPFAFDNLDRGGVEVFLGEGPAPQTVADDMHRAWTGFIRDGDPGWAPYASQSRATMRFAEPSELIDDPDGLERAAWEGIR